MNKASHNTMTYLPVRQWWLRPFAFMARCQSKDIKDQCRITGFFDIRVLDHIIIAREGYFSFRQSKML